MIHMHIAELYQQFKYNIKWYMYGVVCVQYDTKHA